jgi:hypothetical protein
MKVIEISNKVYLVRHWFIWYRVQRGAGRWEKLEPVIKNQKPRESTSVDSIDESLKLLKKSGKATSKPHIDI